MSMIVILIEIKFHIDKNNDELLKTVWKHMKKRAGFLKFFFYFPLWPVAKFG
jgi:hypothetical protein